MQQSDNIQDLAKALAEFKSKVPKISKDAENPFYKNKYATLSKIMDVIKQPLEATGLLYIQMPDGEAGMTTTLYHVESGQFIQATHNMQPKAKDPQAVGSAITYARRYALVSMLGLDVDADDDGNAGSGNNKPTPEQLEEWSDLVNNCRTEEELLVAFNANNNTIAAHAWIKTLFTKRKQELKS